jgi:hypothetical protein
MSDQLVGQDQRHDRSKIIYGIEIVLGIIGALNCIIVPLLFAYYIIYERLELFPTLFPLPGLYLLEIMIFGVLGLVAVFFNSKKIHIFWSAVPWISSGFLLAMVILGAWSIGFFVIPAMLSFLIVGILIDSNMNGNLALHLIYLISAAIVQAVIVFIRFSI